MSIPTHLVVPSGKKFEPFDLELLQEARNSRSVVYNDKPFRLKSGIDSNVYVFCRGDLTDNPRLLNMAGHRIAHDVAGHLTLADPQLNLIGLPTAGTALAVATSLASIEIQKQKTFPLIACRVMREQLKKSHGANNRWVNGETDGPPNLKRFLFGTLDNVATDGGTKFEAAERLEQDGYPNKDMLQVIFIDRQQGAVRRLEAAGFKRIVVSYNLLDITYVYGELGLWPKNAVKSVEAEIKAHQFL